MSEQDQVWLCQRELDECSIRSTTDVTLVEREMTIMKILSLCSCLIVRSQRISKSFYQSHNISLKLERTLHPTFLA